MSIIKVDYGELTGGGATLEEYQIAGSEQKSIKIKNGIVQGYYVAGQHSSAINVVVKNGVMEYNKSSETATYTNGILTVSSALAMYLYVMVAD